MNNKKFRFGPVELTVAMTTNLLSPPEATGGVNAGASPMYVLLRRLTVINTNSGTKTFSLWLGGTGTNATADVVIASGQPVAGHNAYPWAGELRIDAGEFLVGGASATGLVIQGDGEIGVAG
jgi:hypothetical protein